MPSGPSKAVADRGRVLVVDDEPAMRRLVTRWMEDVGWEVRSAGDAASARAALVRETFDLILVDFVLPDADGVGLLRDWRVAGVRAPILALTGAQSESVLEELVRAGANDVLDKGDLTPERLLEAIREASPSPFAPAPRRADAREEAEPPAVIKPGTALVIDDVGVSRRVARMLLEAQGWRVFEAATAAEGVSIASARGHDVILIDYLLPDVDGLGLIEELRAQGIQAPVVVLSGHGDEALVDEFVRAGAADFIPKETLTASRLQEALARALAPRVEVRTSPSRMRRRPGEP